MDLYSLHSYHQHGDIKYMISAEALDSVFVLESPSNLPVFIVAALAVLASILFFKLDIAQQVSSSHLYIRYIRRTCYGLS